MKRRAIVFIDGQNLFHAAQREFGYSWPNFDAYKLACLLCERTGSRLHQTRFYSGVPTAAADPFWHSFWANKCCQMERNRVITITRPMRVHAQDNHAVFHEKGIDLRIGLDLVRAAHAREADLLILVSADQDFVEAVRDARQAAHHSGHKLKIASAFPDPSGLRHGVYQTNWLSISADEYAACLDPHDYRPTARQLKNLTQTVPAPGHSAHFTVLPPGPRTIPRPR